MKSIIITFCVSKSRYQLRTYDLVAEALAAALDPALGGSLRLSHLARFFEIVCAASMFSSFCVGNRWLLLPSAAVATRLPINDSITFLWNAPSLRLKTALASIFSGSIGFGS